MIEQDPRLTEGPTFFQSLYALLKRIITAANTNEKNIATVTTSDAGKVNRAGDTMTGGLNLVSPSTSATEAASDNSTRIATTAWAKLGFVFSSGSPGYIKFPTWMGGWIVQWGTATTTTSGVTVTFPLAFPTAVRVVQTTPVALGAFMTTFQSLSNTTVFIQGWNDAGAQSSTLAHWLAVGS